MTKHILVVDDSESIRSVVSYTLEQEGFFVDVAIHGADALEKAEKNDYGLVITDLYMPVMDGLQLIREIRKIERYKRIPILFLTTESMLEKKQEARQAGATGWIVKPFEPAKLLDTVKKVYR